MDAAESLLDAVRVPRQVVVDHQVGALEVHAFSGGVGGDQDLDDWVIAECVLHPAAILAADPSVDGHDGLWPTHECLDLGFEVVQRVPVLGEDDDLARLAGFVELL